MNRKQFVLSIIGAGATCAIPAVAFTSRDASANSINDFIESVEQLRSRRPNWDIQASVHKSVVNKYKKAAAKHWGKHPDWLTYSVFGDIQAVLYKSSSKRIEKAEDMYDLNIGKDPETKYNGFRPTCINHAVDCAMSIVDDSTLTKGQKSKEMGKIMEGVMHFGAIPWYKEAKSQDTKNIRYLGVRVSA